MRSVILLLTLSMLLCSCASNKRWKSHHHTSRVRYDQDNAFCKMKSNEAYDNSRGNAYYNSTGDTITSSEGYYDPYTGDYSSTSRTKQQHDYIGGMVDAVSRGLDASEAFELCMQSKGYYRVESSKNSERQSYSLTNSPTSKSKTGRDCRKHTDCSGTLKCYEQRCVTQLAWDQGITQKRREIVEIRGTRKVTTQEDAATLFRQAGKCFKGDGVPKDYEKASRLLQKAADQGYGKAQGALGGMYYTGQGVNKNYSKAFNLSKAAAEQGLLKAQVLVGRMYFKGEGVSKNWQEAAKWLLKAAKKGNVQSQGALSEIYYENKDYKASVKWFRKAFLSMTPQQKEQVFNPNNDKTSEELIGFYALLETMVLEKKDDAVQYRDNILNKLSPKELEYAQQVVSEIQTTLNGQAPNGQKKYSRLTVNVTPPTCKVRILNIKPKYSPEMTLPYGKYHVEISKDGYETKRQWVSLRLNITDISVVLQKTAAQPIKTRLLVVQDLYQSGLMTEEEYQAKRQEIMSDL